MHLYSAAGLALDSDIVLPGLLDRETRGSTPDVTVRGGAVPVRLDGPDASGPTWDLAGDLFLLRIPGVARFLLRGGTAIVYEPDAGGDFADVAIFLLGTVLGVLLHQRGQIVLHAGGTEVCGKAVLFCGRSGAGKSTLAAALAQRGFRCVNDDVAAISVTDAGVPVVHSDGRQLKLWAQSIHHLGLTHRPSDRVRRRLEKYYVDQGGGAARPLPLGAVYVLAEPLAPERPGIARANIVDTALLIRRNAYRPRLVRRMEQRPRYLHAAAAIASAAGVYRLTRPLDFAAMPALISQLEEHWSEVGLLPGAHRCS